MYYGCFVLYVASAPVVGYNKRKIEDRGGGKNRKKMELKRKIS